MTPDPDPVSIVKWHRHLYLIAAVMTYLLLSSGAVVCITKASHGCPDWPACQGKLIPPAQMKPVIEWSHRLGSVLTLPFIIVAVVIGFLRYRRYRWLSWSPLAGFVLILVVAAFGRWGILYSLSRAGAAADVGCALAALAALVAAAVASSRQDDSTVGDRLSFRGGFAKLSLVTLASVFLVLVSSVLVARKGEVVRCLVWPVYNGTTKTTDVFGWLQLARIGLSVLSTALVGALVVQAWRTHRNNRRVLLHATAAGALLAVATILGIFIAPDRGIVIPLISLVPTVAVWGFLVAVVMRVGLQRSWDSASPIV